MNTSLSAYEACFKKRLYWTEEEAIEAVRGAWGRNGVTLEHYPCHIGRHGTHWHIGHPSASADKNRRLRTFGPQTILTGR